MSSNLKAGYNFVCPVCGVTGTMEPSLFQHMGILDSGRGNCIKCNASLHLTIDDSLQRCDAELFADYVERLLNEKRKGDEK